ncbi:MAG: 3-deoxy-manno-octulosonate cytidylyltransferase [Acidobacteriota bacterium]
MAQAIGIIPARYASTRFPGKPLANLSGKPLLQHVYERALMAARFRAVWVATDDARIADLVAGSRAHVVMTAPSHRTGTDRVAEAAARPEAGDADIIVNIQGDQPLVDPAALDRLVEALEIDPDLEMATLFEPVRSVEDLLDPNAAKVVADRQGFALYFSRSPVPYYRKPGNMLNRRFETDLTDRPEGLAGFLKHVGVYAFRKQFLLEFGRLERGPLEIAEGLEQLRALESGHRIKLVPSSGISISVETPGDIRRIESLMESS